MLSALITKDIRNHVLSFRFQATFLLLLVIVPLTVLVLTNDYVRKQDDYSRRQAAIQAYLARYAHFNRVGAIVAPTQPPFPILALVRGLSADTNMEAFDNDPLPVMFPLIDLTFIVAILLSLAALVFTYDALSGEKEDGTLKLMLANGVSRARIILAKILGGFAALFISFLVSLILGLILLLLNPRVGWRGTDWGALGLILAGAILYLAFFAGLGVLISSRHRSSAASVMTSLFVWVLLVLVVPNLCPYAASLLRPVPSRIKIGREIARLTDVDRDDLARSMMKERLGAVIRQYPVLNGIERRSDAEKKAAAANDPSFAEAYEAYRKADEAVWKEANTIQGAKAAALTEDLERRQKAQTELSETLAMISPLADFSFLAADLSNTGMRNREHFGSLFDAWSRAGDEYRQKKMQVMLKADPTVDVWNTPTDMTDMPRFVYPGEGLAGRIKPTVPKFIVLIAAAFAVFAAGFVSFIRYDAR